MSRAASLLAAVSVSLLSLSSIRCGDAGSSESASSRAGATSEAAWVVEPRVLDFGRYSSCAPPGPLAVRIANPGTRPLAVGDWSSSCRCVVATFGGVTEIPPGGVLDVAVTLTPWGMPGPHGHDLELRLGRPPDTVPVRIEYRMDPEVAVPRELHARSGNPDGVVRIESSDGQPFRVRGLDPPIPARWPAEASNVVEFEIPWALLDRIWAGDPVEGLDAADADRIRERMRRRPDGSWRGIWIRADLDHPVCDSVSIPRSNDRSESSNRPASRSPTATSP